MSTPLNEPAWFPFSQWLVALIGCEAALPSARATRARAMVDVMLAAVPDTNAERRVRIQSDILRSSERITAVKRVHDAPVPGGSLRSGGLLDWTSSIWNLAGTVLHIAHAVCPGSRN